MSNLKGRVKQLESKAPKAPIVFDVRLVDEITDEMRQEAREARARGEHYINCEPPEVENQE